MDICITKAAPEQALIHGESGLRKYPPILAPVKRDLLGKRSKGTRGKLLLPEAWFKSDTLLSIRELNRKQGVSLLADVTSHSNS